MREVIRIGPLVLSFMESGSATAGSLDLFEMTVPPDARMPVPHYHRDWDETVYGLTGTTTWTVAGTAIDVGPGDHVFIRRGTVHGFDNRTQESASCLCVLTPGVLGQEYFREVAALAVSGPPDPDRMRAVMERHGLVPVPPP